MQTEPAWSLMQGSKGKMRVDVGKDRQSISVHAMNFDHRGGPAFYASLSADDETLKGCRANRAGGEHHLVSCLLEHVSALESPLWKRRHLLDRDVFPINVVRDPFGRPHLLLGEYRGPAISFSEGGGRLWATVCGDESDIGIDAAATDEFQGDYPLHRVFHDQELQHAVRLTGGDLAKASALLWSIKEAAVKALGCAFHLVAPRQVHVHPSIAGDGGYTFPVRLSSKPMVRFSPGDGRFIWVRSLPRAKMWLSIALLSWQPR